jgi:hypothetical protein
LAILRDRAVQYLDVALANITREYPHMPYFIANGPADYRTHRELHPVYYGCFDWHSCVEMHWAIIRLLRRFPELPRAVEARATLNELLIPAHIEAEAAFFAKPEHGSLERPYGWGWLLMLQQEVATWEDDDGRRWAAAMEPLSGVLRQRLIDWLPKLTYPQRVGVHANTAFGLWLSFGDAARRAADGDVMLLDEIRRAALRWFADDIDYPAHYEPSGADFLSAALAEAMLMTRVIGPADFPAWLTRFLPGLASAQPDALFQPALVSDPTDGQIAHLHGLNLSRGHAFVAIAEQLPDGEERIGPLLDAAEHHAHVSLPHVAGSDYMVEHWLAAYATLLLS